MSPEEKIRKTIETGNISHAYIFEGSRISGKEAAAVSFLMAINGGKNLEADPDHYEVRAEAGQGRTVKSVKDADLEKLFLDVHTHGCRYKICCDLKNREVFNQWLENQSTMKKNC